MLKDHIDGFELSDELLQQFANEANALDTLITGLNFHFGQVSNVESVVRSRIEPGTGVFVVGNDPLTDGLPMHLITCSFHWYAVSVCNFVRLIGWLHHTHDPTAMRPDHYVEAVLRDVLPFRDKVAAHFARVFPKSNKRDCSAEREISVITNVGFHGDTFVASPLTLALSRGCDSSTSSSLRPWSLTKVHNDLRKRYWPDQSIQ